MTTTNKSMFIDFEKYDSDYARKFVEKFPRHKDLFVFRQQLTPRINAKRKES